MRIVFVTQPALGHLLPLLPLATAARDAGHDVVVVAGLSLAPAVAHAGLHHVVAGPPDLAAVFARVPERAGLTGRRLAVATWRYAFAGLVAPALATGVLELSRTWRPDLVVHEDSEQGSWIAAERLGVPHVTVQATAWRGSRYRLSAEPLGRLLSAHGLPADPGLARWHRFGFLTTRPPALHDPDDPMPRGTRPMRPEPSDEAGGEAVAWPEGPVDRRVVVTMGTVVPGRIGTLAAILDGLEQLGVPIVATVGHDLDPTDLGPRPPTTRLARYVPMSSILAGASLLVFHGGSGTMLAALAAGVPTVALPVAADQPDNAERCVAAGVGVALAPDARDAAAVREAAATVLGDPSYRAAALAVRDQIRAMPAPQVVLRDLERLVARGRW